MSGDQQWTPLEISPADAGSGVGGRALAEYLADLDALDELLVREKAVVFRGSAWRETSWMR